MYLMCVSEWLFCAFVIIAQDVLFLTPPTLEYYLWWKRKTDLGFRYLWARVRYIIPKILY